ncbi:LacI family DNA-binding transcriptional regulator [Parapedobacter deserti]|uniref:LacI family DNA-binding transcriptional regulator n=1 Tax=Parapedobacter deserti TaxID=1912957 RepID=A0ABV7JLF8_9SPHI
MKKRQTTITDIAKKLHISKSTVSRALQNHPNVSQKTRKAVLDLANEMDYRRNLHALSLLNRKSNTIGIIVPELIGSYFPQMIISAQKEAIKAGYNIIISQCNECYKDEVENAKLMLAYQVDGLLISLTKETRNYDHLEIFLRKGIPVVFFNRICEKMIVPKVIVDDYEGAFLAVEHLIETNKRRIAHLGGPPSLAISRHRLNGYKDALKKHQIPIDEELIVSFDLSFEKINIYLQYFLSLQSPPDAIFVINDTTAIEVIQLLKRKGLRIPEDVAVVGFSDDYASALIDPPLTTVAQPIELIGATAAKMLIEQIDRDVSEWKAVTKMLKTNLVIRQSTVKLKHNN